MGSSSSTSTKINPTIDENVSDDKNENGCDFPLEIHVAHYTPASFPLTPVVTKSTIAACRESWTLVLMPVEREDGSSVSGMTLFYTEFYDTLEVIDTMGKFESVLLQHTGGIESKLAKGGILLRIVNYALNVEPESERSRYALYCLGKAHNQKSIRPWQYSIFIQCLLTTLSSRLGSNATFEVMSAWVHLFAFMLRNILPPAIIGLVDETEVNVNVTNEVGDSATTDELFEADRALEMKKIVKRSHANSRGSSAASSVAHSVQVSSRLPPRKMFG